MGKQTDGFGPSQIWFPCLVIFLMSACSSGQNQNSTAATSPLSCQGIYYSRDTQGNLMKFNQYWRADQKTCLTDKVALTNYEASTESRRKRNITCVPQATFPSVTL